jgi:hypothetical protein
MRRIGEAWAKAVGREPPRETKKAAAAQNWAAGVWFGLGGRGGRVVGKARMGFFNAVEKSDGFSHPIQSPRRLTSPNSRAPPRPLNAASTTPPDGGVRSLCSRTFAEKSEHLQHADRGRAKRVAPGFAEQPGVRVQQVRRRQQGEDGQVGRTGVQVEGVDEGHGRVSVAVEFLFYRNRQKKEGSGQLCSARRGLTRSSLPRERRRKQKQK